MEEMDEVLMRTAEAKPTRVVSTSGGLGGSRFTALDQESIEEVVDWADYKQTDDYQLYEEGERAEARLKRAEEDGEAAAAAAAAAATTKRNTTTLRLLDVNVASSKRGRARAPTAKRARVDGAGRGAARETQVVSLVSSSDDDDDDDGRGSKRGLAGAPTAKRARVDGAGRGAARQMKGARASGRGSAPKRERSSGVVWSGFEASTSGAGGASGSGSNKSTMTREPPALKALVRVDEEKELRNRVRRMFEAASDEIDATLARGDWRAAKTAAGRISQIMQDDGEKYHLTINRSDADIKAWAELFLHLDTESRSARSLARLFDDDEWYATCSGVEGVGRYEFTPQTNRYLGQPSSNKGALCHKTLANAWDVESRKALGVSLGGHHLFIDADEDFFRHFHRHADKDKNVSRQSIGILQLGAPAKISFHDPRTSKSSFDIVRRCFDASFMTPSGRITPHEVSPMDMNPGSAAACGSVIKIDTLKARAESDASFCAATADLADVDIFTIVHAKSVASLVTGIIHAGLDRSDVEPEPIVAPKSFQRSGMSQFGMQFGIQGNQKLKSMPPLDQSLTRADGRLVPNRKSEIAVKADQKLKSMPPLDQSLTRADGRLVPNRKSEMAVLVNQKLKSMPPLDQSLTRADGRLVPNRKSEIAVKAAVLVNQKLKSMPPLDQSLTRADGRLVPNRKSEMAVLVNQKLKSMPPLDQSLTRADGRLVPNRKSEIAVKADQKLKSMPPLDQSLTRADGRLVPNRKSEIAVKAAVLVNQKLKSMPPLDQSLTRADGRLVPNRKSEIAVKAAVLVNQKLKSMPPLDQSLTRADGRLVPNRKVEIGVVVTKKLRNAPPIDQSHIMQNGSKVESRMQEISSTSRLGTMNVSADHRELQLRWGHGHSCKILGTIAKGNENVWAASSTSYATSRDALRSLYEHAANERLSREYAFSNLPKYLQFNGGWNCKPPFTDELQKCAPGSFGNLLRELVANEKLDVKVVQIQAMSKSKRVKRKDSNR